MPRAFISFGTALIATACGGGAATMHPAHVLPQGRVSAGAGLSSTFAIGAGATAIDRARSTTTGPIADEEQRFLDGVLADSLFAPGLAPWVGARVGIGDGNEAGATYTGRTIRIDGRHAFGNETVALSVGAGASGVLMHPRSVASDASSDAAAGGRFTGKAADVSATGFGFDVPIIVGMRSAGQIVQGWIGGRAGFERIRADLNLDTSSPGGDPARATGTRFYGGGLIGASIGVSPLWVTLQLDVAYQSVSGQVEFPANAAPPGELKASFSGMTLVPTGAVVGKF